jgi:hypothetical protein
MVACKEPEYDVAVLYLQHADWDLERAVEGWKEDERWEREHPLKAKDKGKEKGKGKVEAAKRRFLGRS